MGFPEPSFRTELGEGKESVKRLARDLRGLYDQDAVTLLIPKKGGEGGILTWNFGRALSDEELKKVLAGIRKVNNELSKDILSFDIWITSRGDALEFWFGDKKA